MSHNLIEEIPVKKETTTLYLKDGRELEVAMEDIEQFIEDNWGNLVTEKKDWVPDPIVKSTLRL